MAKLARRVNIPMTPQTDPANFPAWEMRHYPKMINKLADASDVKLNLLEKGTDPLNPGNPDWRPIEIGQLIPLRATAEHVSWGLAESVGDPVLVRNPTEEFKVTGVQPTESQDASGFIHRMSSDAPPPANDARVEALERSLAETQRMMQQMLDMISARPVEAPKRRGRKPAAEATGTDANEVTL